ncbi:MAG: isoprenylcysteine carboxylmethyltransferase family protein [Proteobacteria bacterium]|nr:isoprenylcysteine carboxylmethyltransferase family protein [Pseudomonadota bacterium]
MTYVQAATAPSLRRIASLGLDLIERLILIALFYGLATRLVANYVATHNIADLLALASEGMVVVLALIRRTPQAISFRIDDWAIAFGGACATLFLRPVTMAPLGPKEIGWLLQAIGFVGALWCKAALFRNFGVAPAIRGVEVRGPYALLRHPMYASYAIAQLGFLYAFPTLWNVAIIAVWAGLQLLRINAEERMLKTEPRYLAYAAKVRRRLIPWVY